MNSPVSELFMEEVRHMTEVRAMTDDFSVVDRVLSEDSDNNPENPDDDKKKDNTSKPSDYT